MKYTKQNLLILLAIAILLVNCYFTITLLNTQQEILAEITMSESQLISMMSSMNYQPPAKPEPIAYKEVMSPLDLANYLGIPMMKVYDIATTDSTMPYLVIDGEYRFSKVAIDKWMETRRSIVTK